VLTPSTRGARSRQGKDSSLSCPIARIHTCMVHSTPWRLPALRLYSESAPNITVATVVRKRTSIDGKMLRPLLGKCFVMDKWVLSQPNQKILLLKIST
jgi:hypothetical protein